ncbi:MAG: response regulator [Candidatus Eisenbacteria bacterium]
MAAEGRLLIADDEVSFLKSTADLLRDEGYQCDCVQDGPSAALALGENEYDLLIADMKMPGNSDLELIREVSRLAEGLPVILITGYPSIRSAIESVKLPVVAYLVKPVDFSELLESVTAAIERSKVYGVVCKTQSRLTDWNRRLEEIKGVLAGKPHDALTVPIDTYVAITLGHIAEGLVDLRSLTAAIAKAPDYADVCRLLDCPKTRTLTGALKETIEIIEKSKRSFKSKELSELRKRLEEIVAGVA